MRYSLSSVFRNFFKNIFVRYLLVVDIHLVADLVVDDSAGTVVLEEVLADAGPVVVGYSVDTLVDIPVGIHFVLDFAVELAVADPAVADLVAEVPEALAVGSVEELVADLAVVEPVVQERHYDFAYQVPFEFLYLLRLNSFHYYH